MGKWKIVALVLIVVVLMVAAGGYVLFGSAGHVVFRSAGAVGDPMIVAAGDIAQCDNGAQATAKLVEGINGTVLALGDEAYNSGTAKEFADCYDPSWGRFKDRTRPVPGNHDYRSNDALPYFDYFGASGGEQAKGYYSFNVGTWHLIALNSNIPAGDGTPQFEWLRDDLDANKTTCTLAFWHHPLFSSGEHGNDERMLDVWKLLYAQRVDVVLNGHDHDYERFAPQSASGAPEPDRGIREFVVGTGGAEMRDLSELRPNSELQKTRTWGVLKMTLHPTSYDWQFIPVEGQDFHDSGIGTCVH